jgi:hypothetical protein
LDTKLPNGAPASSRASRRPGGEKGPDTAEDRRLHCIVIIHGAGAPAACPPKPNGHRSWRRWVLAGIVRASERSGHPTGGIPDGLATWTWPVFARTRTVQRWLPGQGPLFLTGRTGRSGRGPDIFVTILVAILLTGPPDVRRSQSSTRFGCRLPSASSSCRAAPTAAIRRP